MTDMSLPRFLLALIHFCSAKSKPRSLISDIALSFKAASRIVQAKKATDELAKKGIVFVIHSNRYPWMGGHYERMVGLVKKDIERAFGRALISYEDLLKVTSELDMFCSQ